MKCFGFRLSQLTSNSSAQFNSDISNCAGDVPLAKNFSQFLDLVKNLNQMYRVPSLHLHVGVIRDVDLPVIPSHLSSSLSPLDSVMSQSYKSIDLLSNLLNYFALFELIRVGMAVINRFHARKRKLLHVNVMLNHFEGMRVA
jgi:hypothetical protein